jgi:hypothetical protein
MLSRGDFYIDAESFMGELLQVGNQARNEEWEGVMEVNLGRINSTNTLTDS